MSGLKVTHENTALRIGPSKGAGGTLKSLHPDVTCKSTEKPTEGCHFQQIQMKTVRLWQTFRVVTEMVTENAVLLLLNIVTKSTLGL